MACLSVLKNKKTKQKGKNKLLELRTDYSQVTGYKVKTQNPIPFQNTSSEKWSLKLKAKHSVIYICNTKSEILVRV